MKKLLPLFIIILISLNTNAQYFEIGASGGLTFNTYKFKPQNAPFRKTFSPGGDAGISLRYTCIKRYIIELGAYAYTNTKGYGLDARDMGYFISGEDAIVFIPLNIGYQFLLSKKYDIVPFIGASIQFITQNNEGSSGGGYIEDQNTGQIITGYEDYRRLLGKKSFFTANIGFSIERKIGKKFKIVFTPTYYQGLSKYAIYDINYKIDNGPMQYATLEDKGSFLNFNLGVKYRLTKYK